MAEEMVKWCFGIGLRISLWGKMTKPALLPCKSMCPMADSSIRKDPGLVFCYCVSFSIGPLSSFSICCSQVDFL